MVVYTFVGDQFLVCLFLVLLKSTHSRDRTTKGSGSVIFTI